MEFVFNFLNKVGFASLLSFSCLFLLVIIGFLPNSKIFLLRTTSLIGSVFIFIFSLFGFFLLATGGPSASVGFFALQEISWLGSWNVSYFIGLDAISLYFIILSTALIPVCILASWETIKYRMKEFLLLLVFTEFCLVNVFSVLDLFLFYVFFEAVIIPMFIIIGVWGSRLRRIVAAFRFFLYTLAGSVIMLLAVIYIYIITGSFNLYVLYETQFPFFIQVLLWLAFFCSFAVKIPMMPVHVWLPEAHVEAPTAGSVLLAGILLKLGGYGFLRFSLPMFPEASVYLAPFVFTLSIVAIFYSSFTTISQIDLKKIIAYSSVAHMNYVTLGLFTNNIEGIEGAIFLMLSHGVVSSALFLCVGFLYDRYGTRILRYYGGLAAVMPVYSSLLLVFVLANLSLPGTSSFVGEFLVLVGTYGANSFVCCLAASGVILSAAYNIWFYNRLCYGVVSPHISYYSDLNKRETFLLLFLLFFVFYLGVRPDFVLETLHLPVSFLINS
jgi:NADH-quinone oxidoreductase subunit M